MSEMGQSSQWEQFDEASQYLLRGFLMLAEAFATENGLEPPAQNMAANPAFSVIEVDDWKSAVALWKEHGLPLLENIAARACPACDADGSHTVLESYDGYRFVECEQCGTWYVPLDIDWPLFARFLAACPSAREIARKATQGRLQNSGANDFPRFEKYFLAASELLAQHQQPLRYLDVGCGVGHSLTAAVNAGMTAHGVEADPDAIALARTQHEVVATHIDELPSNRYDLISMWETLEHLAAPTAMLSEITRRLAPGGLVAVTVPNLDASGLRVTREKCSYVYGGFNSPGHINFFNRRTIERLFARSGLSLIDASYEFSTNALELFGYLGGDMAIDRAFAMAEPPAPVARVLNSIWPSITLLEDLAGTLPIMLCFACHTEDAPLFAPKCKARSQRRQQTIIATVNQHLQGLQDFKAEINKRDTLLREMHDHLQGEVNKRDQMLAEMQKRLKRRW